MDDPEWLEMIALLESVGVKFESGLTDLEVEATEEKFNFRFPPDLRAFLQTALPTGEHLPNWRSRDEAEIRQRLNWPLDGCLFDVEHCDFWLPEWGPKPQLLADALKIATEMIAEAPKLIPIYSHRFIPEEPHEAGNPVFSVYQMDIVYYGFDLDDYLRHEFHLPERKDWPAKVRPVRFWNLDRIEGFR
ncbi:MAG TPA: hypothetical protein VGY94_02960 [Acidobacteriaceae bacterium]|jgi:hypothetical protein|nr:hypothetical protein [Acidobacteriaceae bacterium]